jgi:hypothetical protein
MSVYRFEEWRQRGGVPRPAYRSHGRRGLTEIYPWYTKWQTIAMAEAVREFRNIDSAILALWVEGWPIEADDLRAATTSWCAPIAEAIDEDADGVAWTLKERTQYTARGKRWKRRRGHDRHSHQRYYEVLMGSIGAVAGRGVAPTEVEELMRHTGADAALNQVFARAGEEHGPFPFEEIAENAKEFTLDALITGVTAASEEDLDFARTVARDLLHVLVHETEVAPEFDRVSAALVGLACVPGGPLRPLIDELFRKLQEDSITQTP